jgi:chromosome segregation ATPase
VTQAAAAFFTLGNVVSWAVLGTFLLGVAAVAGTSFRSSRNLASVQNWRDLAQSLETRTSIQEAEIKELQAQNADKDKAIAALQAQVEYLKDLATGRAAITELAGDVARLADKVDARTSEALSQHGEIRAELRAVHEAVQALHGRP